MRDFWFPRRRKFRLCGLGHHVVIQQPSTRLAVVPVHKSQTKLVYYKCSHACGYRTISYLESSFFLLFPHTNTVDSSDVCTRVAYNSQIRCQFEHECNTRETTSRKQNTSHTQLDHQQTNHVNTVLHKKHDIHVTPPTINPS